jgi:hypothetical protein
LAQGKNGLDIAGIQPMSSVKIWHSLGRLMHLQEVKAKEEVWSAQLTIQPQRRLEALDGLRILAKQVLHQTEVGMHHGEIRSELEDLAIALFSGVVIAETLAFLRLLDELFKLTGS